MKINKAVIVAAGLSSRLYPLTLETPKGLLPVNEEPLLKRSIRLLKANGINDIAVVVGYKRDVMKDALKNEVTYIHNPFYQQCNNMGSLWFGKEFAGDEPFVYLHGDIIYHENILAHTLKGFQERNNLMELVTDFTDTDEEAMKVRVTDENYLVESNKQIPIPEAAGEWTGIAYIREPKPVFDSIQKVLFDEDLNYYDTHAFTQMAASGHSIYCSSTQDLPWMEIDFAEDYEKAQEIFA
jgi:choline kinase